MSKKATWIIPGLLVTLLLGLLWVLPAMAAPSSADNTIVLSGGADDKGLFFSDRTNFNIATATVEDTGFSSQRTGKARITNGGGVTTFDLTAATSIIEGEISQTNTFNSSGGTADQTLTLAKPGRDANGDGVLDEDDVVLKVGGVVKNPDGAAVGVTIVGNAITAVILDSADNTAAGTKNVTVQYESSEYDSANTPLAGAASHTVQFGASFASLTNSVLVFGVNSSTSVLTISGTPVITGTDEVLITFKYDVIDTVANFVTFSTPSQVDRGLTRRVAGVETSATSNVFTAKVALFSASDFDRISVSANKSAVTSISLIAADVGASGTLNARVTAAATALGFTDHSVVGSAASFLALVVATSDGEVLTSSYVDGSTTRSDTADMDLKAPTLKVVSPADGAYINYRSQILILEVTDELSAGGKASGIAVGDVDQLVIKSGGSTSTGTTLVPLAIATDSWRVSRSHTFVSGDEGKIEWWVPTKDKVGNIPDFTGSDAVTGAGDPNTPSALPGDPVVLNLDLAPPNPITNAVKTGGSIDTRLTVVPTGSHTGSLAAASLTDTAASLVSAGVKVGDKISNVTDGSSCTLTAVTSTVATCALGGGSTWDTGDNYTIKNPELGNVKEDGKALNFVHVEFDLGTGTARIDPTTVDASDFNVIGSTIVSATVDKKGNKILLELGADLNTAAKPKLELPGVIKDLSNNQMAAITSTNAITALDQLAPIINFNTSDIVGDASGQPASKGKVTIDFSSGEAASSTPTVTAAYLESSGGSLIEGTPKTLSVSSTGINAWRATVDINDILGGASTAGLVNVRISLTDSSGNTASAGLTDPDGTSAGKIKSAARVFEFDYRLNEGISAVKDVFVVSPNTGTTAAPKTDAGSPFITVNFDNTTGLGGEDKEYTTAGGIEVDTHDNVTITSASWTNPDGSTVDVLSQLNQADDNSYVYAPSGLAVGTHTFTLQAKDEVGNVSTSIGSTTPTNFKLTLVVTTRATYKVPLKPGANFFSIPATPSVDDVNQIIGNDVGIDVILTYDNATGLWLVASRDKDPESPTFDLLVGTLGTIDAAHAYWVVTDRFQNLAFQLPRTTAGTAVLPSVIPVFKGWNVVPIGDPSQAVAGTSIDPDTYFAGLSWSAAVFYDPARPAYIKTTPGGVCTAVTAPPATVPTHPCLTNGSGVYVYVTADGVIIP